MLGLNGATAPSNRIVFGGIGIGNRARAILPNFLSFPEINFVAVSDAREDRLKSAKDAVDAQRAVQILETLGQPPDHPVLAVFPESEYLKGAICRAD